MQKQALDDGTLQFTWATGHAQIKTLSPGVIFICKVGYFPAATFTSLVAPFDVELKRTGQVVMVCDCGEMSNYESAYRLRWTEWFRASQGRVRAHIYTRSQFVRMAMSVINLVVPVFTPHNSLASLERTLATLVPSFSPRMLPPSASIELVGAR